jgi:hypothetical protein
MSMARARTERDTCCKQVALQSTGADHPPQGFPTLEINLLKEAKFNAQQSSNGLPTVTKRWLFYRVQVQLPRVFLTLKIKLHE